jgi:uncharacterized coiled-coil protein SlyX
LTNSHQKLFESNTDLSQQKPLEMAELDNRIANLEARVAKYEFELDSASTAKEKSEIRQLINSARETLNRLLDEKKAQSLGE